MKPTTVPVPAKLRSLIEAHGLRGDIVLTHPDGTPATPEEAAELADVVAALDVLDRRTARALATVARVLPAAMMSPPVAAKALAVLARVLPAAMASSPVAAKAKAKPKPRKAPPKRVATTLPHRR